MPAPPRRRRGRLAALLLLLLLAALALCPRRAPLVLGSFNIRTFPGARTDPDAVAAAIAELDADAFAVQEIYDPAALDAVLADASARTGRRYAAALTPSCRPHRDGRLYVGVVHDESRLRLLERRPIGAGDTCPPDQPPGLFALLADRRGERLALASVHLQSGGSPEAFAARRRQWRGLARLLPQVAAEFAAPAVLAGDFNSTGMLDPDSAERRFLAELLAAHRLQLPTAALACTEYWRPAGGRFEPSLLDHVVAADDLTFGTPEVLGMCAALRCAPVDEAPPEYHAISDHCPVRIELRR